LNALIVTPSRENHLPPKPENLYVKIDHVRQGKHAVRYGRQAIAIGLSKARRAGVNLPAPKKGHASSKVRRQARRDLAKGRSGRQAMPSRALSARRPAR